jgi:hypothetical protein
MAPFPTWTRKSRPRRPRKIAPADAAPLPGDLAVLTDALLALGDPAVQHTPVDTTALIPVDTVAPAPWFAIVAPTLLVHELLAFILGARTFVGVHVETLRIVAWVVGASPRNTGQPRATLSALTRDIVKFVRSIDPTRMPTPWALQRLKHVIKIVAGAPVAPALECVPLGISAEFEVFSAFENAVATGTTQVALWCVRQMCRTEGASMVAGRLPLHAMTLVNWQDMGLVVHTLGLARDPTERALLNATYALCTSPRSLLWNLEECGVAPAFTVPEYDAAVQARNFVAAMALLLAAGDADGVWGALGGWLPGDQHAQLRGWDADTLHMYTATALAFGTALAVCRGRDLGVPRLPFVARLA